MSDMVAASPTLVIESISATEALSSGISELPSKFARYFGSRCMANLCITEGNTVHAEILSREGDTLAAGILEEIDRIADTTLIEAAFWEEPQLVRLVAAIVPQARRNYELMIPTFAWDPLSGRYERESSDQYKVQEKALEDIVSTFKALCEARTNLASKREEAAKMLLGFNAALLETIDGTATATMV